MASASRSGSRKTGLALGTGLGALMVALGFLVGAHAIADNSFLTHTATGRLILEMGTVPVRDPYSFTAKGAPWTVQSWLASVVYALLTRGSAPWAIRAFNGLLTALVTGAVWSLTRPARAPISRVLLTGITMAVGTLFWQPRPLLFGLVALCAVLLALRGRFPLPLLIPTLWLWVNSHGSFPLALVTALAFAGGRYLDTRRLPRRELRVSAWVAVGIVSGVLSPVGLRLLWFPIRHLARRQALAHVMEWKPPTWTTFSEQAFLLLALVTLVLAIRRRAPWRVVVPAVVFSIAALLAIRNLGASSLVLVALAAPLARSLRPGRLSTRRRGWAGGVFGVAALAVAAFGGRRVLTTSSLALERYPVAEVDWLDAHHLVARPEVRLVSRELVGNYLEWRYGTAANVFMDDRFDVYPQDVIRDEGALLFGGDYRPVMQRWNPDVVLWEADSGFVSWLRASPEWDIVRRDSRWVIACRVASPVRERCGPGHQSPP